MAQIIHGYIASIIGIVFIWFALKSMLYKAAQNQGYVQGSLLGETFIVSDLALQSQHIWDETVKYNICKSFQNISASFHNQKFQNTETIPNATNSLSTNLLLLWDIHAGQKRR